MEWGSEPVLASTAAPRYIIYVLNTFQPWLETLVWYEINLSIIIYDIKYGIFTCKQGPINWSNSTKGFMSGKNELINSQKE